MDSETRVARAGDLLGAANGDAERRYRLVLANESIISPRELPQLLDHLAALLREVLVYDFATAFLTDPETGVARLLSIESQLETRLRYDGLEVPTAGTRVGACLSTQLPVIVADVETEPHLPQFHAILREHEVRSDVLVPLTTAVRRIGVLDFILSGRTRTPAQTSISSSVSWHRWPS